MKEKSFPTLYKKTSTGAIQTWEIKVDMVNQGFNMYPEISTRYGQMGTDSPQYTFDLIKEGKNVGKANETSPYEQAVSEANAKWEKQKKKGYVESLESAEKGETDALIEGGIVPMLAHKFSEQGHKIKYPAFMQPKLDGIRCIAILKNGKCTLWSRTRKPITSVPHIIAAIEKAFKVDVTLDGELYNHEYKNNFEKIVSLVRQEQPAPGHEVVQYHVYDLPSNEPFSKRAEKMKYIKSSWFNNEVIKVETIQAEDEAHATEYFNMWRNEGYEGAMIRNADGLYVNKRSYDLQKMKEFDDGEFEIIGVDEGRGRLSGHVGAFRCRTREGKEFLAKMSGDTGRLREYFIKHELWEGKWLTVQYQGLTGAEGVPRFPVGLTIRDYE